MIRTRWTRGIVCALAMVASACAFEKQSDPLSPSVAGPIAGVSITTPALVQPVTGSKFAVDQQPISFVITNPTTSGVRPISLRFEVASDVAFTSIVFAVDGVALGSGAQTTYRLATALAADRSYYWRVRAQDGANSGSFSIAGQFFVYTPVVLGTPVGTSPVNDAVTTSVRPVLTFTNAPRTGPAVPILYTVEVASTASFSNLVWGTIAAEQSLTTSVTVATDLANATQYFWRVRGASADPVAVSPWSVAQSFKTPAAAPTPPSGGGGTPSPYDQLDLRTVTILKGPTDISSWPVDSKITNVQQGNGQLCIWHEKLGIWPSTIFFGDPGTLVEGNQWVFMQKNGQWYAGAGDWYRPGQACKGVDAASIGADAFDREPLHSWVPQPGELFGVMSSTPARVWPDMKTLDVRTNIVLLRWQ